MIKFVTSCSRPPLLGFKHLNPWFTLQRIEGVNRLPIAATCFNILKLPPYANKALLRDKVLKAVTLAAGFYVT